MIKALLILCPLLATAQVCPPNAQSSVASAFASAWRQDGTTPIAGGWAHMGETILLRMSVAYIPTDPFTQAPTASFYGGTMSLTFEGQTIDVTPAIVELGPTECHPDAQMFVKSRFVPYTVGTTNFALHGAYNDGIARYGENARVSAYSFTQVRVAGDGPLHLEQGTLWFYGDGQQYAIESSEDLKQWHTLATVQPVNKLARYIDSESATQRFYRYRRLN